MSRIHRLGITGSLLLAVVSGAAVSGAAEARLSSNGPSLNGQTRVATNGPSLNGQARLASNGASQNGQTKVGPVSDLVIHKITLPGTPAR